MLICAGAAWKRRAPCWPVPAPVINHPLAVLKTGRAANANRLRGVAHLVTPAHRISAAAFAGRSAGG